MCCYQRGKGLQMMKKLGCVFTHAVNGEARIVCRENNFNFSHVLPHIAQESIAIPATTILHKGERIRLFSVKTFMLTLPWFHPALGGVLANSDWPCVWEMTPLPLSQIYASFVPTAFSKALPVFSQKGR
jgi:hypothetical protein